MKVNIETHVDFTMYFDKSKNMPAVLTTTKKGMPKRTDTIEVKFSENVVFLYRENKRPHQIVLIDPLPIKEPLLFKIARWMVQELEKNQDKLISLQDQGLQVEKTFNSEFAKEPPYIEELFAKAG